MKKAEELSLLCGLDCVVVLDPLANDHANKLEIWPPNVQEVKRIIGRYHKTRADRTTKRTTGLAENPKKKLSAEVTKKANWEELTNALSYEQTKSVLVALEAKRRKKEMQGVVGSSNANPIDAVTDPPIMVPEPPYMHKEAQSDSSSSFQPSNWTKPAPHDCPLCGCGELPALYDCPICGCACSSNSSQQCGALDLSPSYLPSLEGATPSCSSFLDGARLENLESSAYFLPNNSCSAGFRECWYPQEAPVHMVQSPLLHGYQFPLS